jgi:hypothetical protein
MQPFPTIIVRGRQVTLSGTLVGISFLVVLWLIVEDWRASDTPALGLALRLAGGVLLGASLTLLAFAGRRWAFWLGLGALVFTVLVILPRVSWIAGEGAILGVCLVWFPHCLPRARQRG